ncbi:hypothetical protein VNO77_20788 [Canavalia gladiata]|uniref:Uncharacterized protein n=1 Tax=Canavalia gladiata TaxID=3824 RepID=A0AAN9LQ53_CANGL
MEELRTEILEDPLADTDCSDEDGSYIEIELDSAPTCYNHDENKSNLKGSWIDDDHDDDGECKEYQLRISISSTISISLPDVQKESIKFHTTVPKVAAKVPTMPSLMSCSSDDDSVSFNPTVMQEIPQSESQTKILSASRVIPYDNFDVLYTRKQSSVTTKTTKNGIMKMLIKMKGIKIGAVLASLVKPLQPCQVNNIGNKSGKKYKTFFQCYQKEWMNNPSNGRCNRKSMDQRRRSKHWDLEDDSICGSFRSNKKSNRVMEMDLGSLRGIFSAMGMSIAHKSSMSKRGTMSSSCNSTPIHEGFSLCNSSDNSIQAAIAHCKSSLGQTSDFSFRSSFSSSPSQIVTSHD